MAIYDQLSTGIPMEVELRLDGSGRLGLSLVNRFNSGASRLGM